MFWYRARKILFMICCGGVVLQAATTGGCSQSLISQIGTSILLNFLLSGFAT